MVNIFYPALSLIISNGFLILSLAGPEMCIHGYLDYFLTVRISLIEYPPSPAMAAITIPKSVPSIPFCIAGASRYAIQRMAIAVVMPCMMGLMFSY